MDLMQYAREIEPGLYVLDKLPEVNKNDPKHRELVEKTIQDAMRRATPAAREYMERRLYRTKVSFTRSWPFIRTERVLRIFD